MESGIPQVYSWEDVKHMSLCLPSDIKGFIGISIFSLNMKDPKVGSQWKWNNPYHSNIKNDLTVKVKDNKVNRVIVEIINPDENLEKRVTSARKRYMKHGADMENVDETHPLVEWDGEKGEFAPRKEITILQVPTDRFAEEFEKA